MCVGDNVQTLSKEADVAFFHITNPKLAIRGRQQSL